MRSLSDAEQNYSAPERECLAVVWALQTLRPYLLYERFTVSTYHHTLHWLLNVSEPSGLLTSWRLRFAEYDFEIRYKKGKLNQQQDALSCLLTGCETVADDPDDIPTFSVDPADNERDISASTITFDVSSARDDDNFTEVDYAPVDDLLAVQETPSTDINFNEITLHDFLSA